MSSPPPFKKKNAEQYNSPEVELIQGDSSGSGTMASSGDSMREKKDRKRPASRSLSQDTREQAEQGSDLDTVDTALTNTAVRRTVSSLSGTAEPSSRYTLEESFTFPDTSKVSHTYPDRHLTPKFANKQAENSLQQKKQLFEMLGIECKSSKMVKDDSGLSKHEATFHNIYDHTKTATLTLAVSRVEVDSHASGAGCERSFSDGKSGEPSDGLHSSAEPTVGDDDIAADDTVNRILVRIRPQYLIDNAPGSPHNSSDDEEDVKSEYPHDLRELHKVFKGYIDKDGCHVNGRGWMPEDDIAYGRDPRPFDEIFAGKLDRNGFHVDRFPTIEELEEELFGCAALRHRQRAETDEEGH